MTSHSAASGGRAVLALAIAVGLAGGEARAASQDDDRGDGPAVAILDPGAKDAIAADLASRARSVVVTRFSVAADASARASGVSSQGCPAAARANQPGAPASASTAALDPKILDAISARLAKRLARRVAVATQTSADQAPPRAVVVTGCITRFEAGSSVKRWVGLHYGASRLAAHVRVNEKLGRGGLKPVAEFDVAVTGGSLLPPLSPIGVAVHAVTMNRQTLAADASKLGNRVSYAIEDAFLPERD